MTTQRAIWAAADLPIRAAADSEYLLITAYEDTP
jgi:hypothetical protein